MTGVQTCALPILNPQLRLCPKFDPDSIAEFHVGEPGEMGVRVVDNCAEEHIM